MVSQGLLILVSRLASAHWEQDFRKLSEEDLSFHCFQIFCRRGPGLRPLLWF